MYLLNTSFDQYHITLNVRSAWLGSAVWTLDLISTDCDFKPRSSSYRAATLGKSFTYNLIA